MTKPNPQDELERLIDANPHATEDEIREAFWEQCCEDPALMRAVIDDALKTPAILRAIIDDAHKHPDLVQALGRLGLVPRH